MSFQVLIIADDVVGRRMAGPGIRAWEIARVLATDFSVRLFAPDTSDRLPPGPPGPELEYYPPDGGELLARAARQADVVYVQGFVLQKFPQLEATERPILVDLYVPFVLENMFHHRSRHADPGVLRAASRHDAAVWTRQLERGNLFLVANRAQHDLVLGALLALGKIDPQAALAGLTHSLLTVPFGVQEGELPVVDRAALRRGLGLPEDAFFLLWGGVLTDWFDPLTLLDAMARLRGQTPPVHLLFLSTGHANPDLPPFAMAARARARARELGLDGETVHFHEGWVPYGERGKFFAAADAGVSISPVHLETRYSFRTRFLDYLRFGLPIVATGGDPLALDLAERGCLREVPQRDAQALAEAIRTLATDPGRRVALAAAARRAAEDYCWSKVVAPLAETLRGLQSDPARLGMLPDLSGPRIRGGGRVKAALRRIPWVRRAAHSRWWIRLRALGEGGR